MRKNKIDNFLNSIFGYEDYRDFLKDYFSTLKSVRSSFSQRYFAKKAGFSSHAFCSYVVNGKRNLSETTISAFIDAIGMDSVKGEYFKNLVLFNQAEKQDEKEKYYELLQKTKRKSNIKSLGKENSFFYEKPYHAIIRELSVNSDWYGDYSKLAAMVYPPITTREAKESVQGLVACGMLIETNGKYTFREDNFSDDMIPAFLKKKTRREVFERGVEVLEALPPSERFAAFSTFMIDKDAYDEINKLFLEFRSKVNNVVLGTKNKEDVYQFTFELFPVSKTKEK